MAKRQLLRDTVTGMVAMPGGYVAWQCIKMHEVATVQQRGIGGNAGVTVQS